MFAWTPSIGIGNLVEMTADRFDVWKGDLLLATLRERSLYRVKVLGDRMVNMEKMPIGPRIRDIVEDPEGRLILWTDFGEIVTVQPVNDSEDGEALFAACSGCHVVTDGLTHGIGPDLKGVLNRRPGGAKNYDYSVALAELDGTWTKKRLRELLADPEKVVPGTSMIMEPIPDLKKAIGYRRLSC